MLIDIHKISTSSKSPKVHPEFVGRTPSQGCYFGKYNRAMQERERAHP